MNCTQRILVALLLSTAGLAKAENCMSGLPESLRSNVELDNWTIVQPSDLSVSDLKNWKNAHPGQCPGVADGNFFPKVDHAFIVALTKKDNQENLLEKVVLVTQRKDRSDTAVVVSSEQVQTPYVVWKLPPGRYAGIDGTRASIPRDSFVIQKINSSTNQFYYQGTRLQFFVISK
jgi:hypothetical protein